MPELTLFHIAPSRSSIVHWMLEEIGEPYELRVLDQRREENRQAEFLAINPMGKVPVLLHGNTVITEAAAICLYLAERFPAAALEIPVTDPYRGDYLKWLFFGPSCLEPAVIDRMFKRDEAPASALGWGNLESALDAIAAALRPGPYLLGERFTAADVVIGSGLRWGMAVKIVPERPEFVVYVGRLEQRPALRRTLERDQVLASGQR